MANLIIKPNLAADSFQMKDAGSNVILTVEGQTDSGVSAAGRIIYGKGVNETLGTISQAGTVITIDLATGTFFEHELDGTASTWKILHLPAAGTIAGWVVKLKQDASAVTNTWTAASDSNYDNGSGGWTDTTPVFHWEGGVAHAMTATVALYDIVAFWTSGGAAAVINSAISGQDIKPV